MTGVVKVIESRHEIKHTDAVVDTRPFGVKALEKLGSMPGLVIPLVVCSMVSVLFPVMTVFSLLAAVIFFIIHRSYRPEVPFRGSLYGGHTDNDGSPGSGILYLGYVESDSKYEMFKEVWKSDSDAREHMLIMGGTGSGKSETLKGILYNALTWSGGYFVADGKADNKLSTDNYALARSFGRDDDVLVLNFLLGGSSPQKIHRSRRRRSNGLNPFSAADADTIIQMGVNLLPKAEGEGKTWQEKAINLWRAEVTALVYERDKFGHELSISRLIEYLNLDKFAELYIRGYREAQSQGGNWSYGYAAVRSYLEGGGTPGFKIEKLLAQHGITDSSTSTAGSLMGGLRGRGAQQQDNSQDQEVYTQHAYRTSNLLPALNLLDKTYSHIFRAKYSEITMADVTLNNRILLLLIPSLEKSAQEAENLGKLAIACLRVMMSQNLGAESEGTRAQLLSAKATNAIYPYPVALDELGYYFSDGIAVMNAQARSLGFFMCALAQDMEKLTEGSRAAEAGAMIANESSKLMLRSDDPNKTLDLINKLIDKVTIGVRHTVERGAFGYRRVSDVDIKEVSPINARTMSGMEPGQGVLISHGKYFQIRSLYLGNYFKKYRVDEFWINRFLQVPTPSEENIVAYTTPHKMVLDDEYGRGEQLIDTLRMGLHDEWIAAVGADPIIDAIALVANNMANMTGPAERAIAMYQAAKEAVLALRSRSEEDSPAGAQSQPSREPSPESGSDPDAGDEAIAIPRTAATSATSTGSADALAFLDFGGPVTSPYVRKSAQDIFTEDGTSVLDESEDGAEIVVPEVESHLMSQPSVSTAIREGDVVPDTPSPPKPKMRPLLPVRPSRTPGVAAAWLTEAFRLSNQAFLQGTSDRKVVGLCDETLRGAAQVERLLGSPDPVGAARTMERVVSHRVTPTERSPRNEITTADDLIAEFEAIFDSVQKSSG